MLHMADHHHHHNKSQKHPFAARIINFSKWWLAFTGLIATTSVCPFCGQAGCPVGLGFASTMGGLFAIFMQDWKEPFKRLYRWFTKNRHL